MVIKFFIYFLVTIGIYIIDKNIVKYREIFIAGHNFYIYYPLKLFLIFFIMFLLFVKNKYLKTIFAIVFSFLLGVTGHLIGEIIFSDKDYLIFLLKERIANPFTTFLCFMFTIILGETWIFNGLMIIGISETLFGIIYNKKLIKYYLILSLISTFFYIWRISPYL